MYKIILNDSELRKRGQKLGSILSPLRGTKAIPWQKIAKSPKEIIFTAREKQIISNYSDWRFNTFHENFKANYHEIWIEEKNNQWCLERCYLNIYYLDKRTGTESEYICLHADPLEKRYTHVNYKQSFHLHIIKAEQPIPHSHIALGYQFLSDFYKSEDMFFFHFKKHLQLIVDEILIQIPEVII